jgi:L-iditol 2-dehydrogenase
MQKERIHCKAIAFPYPERAEVHKDVMMPAVDDDSVVIKTKYSSISRGTEMDLYHARFHDYKQFYPMLPGYEPAGEVVYKGKNVTHLQEGDRAVVSNLFAGFDERYCVAWGGQCEYIVVNNVSVPQFGALRANKIPDGVSYQEGILSILGAVAYHGMERISPGPDDTIMVIGQGCVGMMAAQIAQNLGARVIVSDLNQYRLNVAEKIGLKETINASKTDQVKKVLELTSGQGADVVIDATGDPSTYNFIWSMVKDHGTVHAQGMVLKPITLEVWKTLFAHSLRFSSSCGEKPRHQKDVLNMIAEGKINAKDMITKEMSYEDATQAYDMAKKKPDEILKLILNWE